MATAGSNIPCTICGLVRRNDLRYGEWLTKSRISVHYFCLLFSTNLYQMGEETSGLRRFLMRDISKLAKSIGANRCDYCHKTSASVYCKHATCTRKFHLICGIENNCLLEFFNTYDTYCSDHYPPATKSYGPDERWQCDICTEDLAEFQLVHTIPSCCDRGWYHVDCMRKYAFAAGYYFGCLNCRRTDKYRDMVQRLGVYVPQHEAQWETKTNYAAMKLKRRCQAPNCAYERTQEYPRNPILLCDHCGAYGMHQRCARAHFETPVDNEFTCAQCAEMVQTRHEETMVDGEYSLVNDTLVDDEDDAFNCGFYAGTDSDSASGSVAGTNPPTVDVAPTTSKAQVILPDPLQKQMCVPDAVADIIMLSSETDSEESLERLNCGFYAGTDSDSASGSVAGTNPPTVDVAPTTSKEQVILPDPLPKPMCVPDAVGDIITLSSETDSEELLESLNHPGLAKTVVVSTPVEKQCTTQEQAVIDQLKLCDGQDGYRNYRLNYWLTHK